MEVIVSSYQKYQFTKIKKNKKCTAQSAEKSKCVNPTKETNY